ncbi:MAG: 4'-phosphopantetheinyl transferase superfamily protein [Acidobacteria bacterium]|nr:4'-phosphopantetheinyl transferase superfamily protein [Acidobacteriota bacterium]
MSPAAGEVVILEIPLDGDVPGDANLADNERRRLSRMRSEAKRREFIVSRDAMRRALGQLLGRSASEVAIELGEHGKPEVCGADFHFNLSHSGDRAVLALSREGPIGIDIEAMAPRRPFARLARRFFAASEIEWFEEYGEDDRREAFYRLWTLKEAYLKAVGTGLSMSSRAFDIRVDGALGELREVPGDLSDRGPWHLETVQLDGAYVVSICTPVGLVSYRRVTLNELGGGSP